MLTKFGLLNLSQVLKIASRFIELRNAHDVSVSVVILNVSNLFGWSVSSSSLWVLIFPY